MRDICEQGRGTRYMASLHIENGSVYGYRLKQPREYGKLKRGAGAARSHEGLNQQAGSGSLVQFYSIHLQGNAKGACLNWLLSELSSKAASVASPPSSAAAPPPPPPPPRRWYSLDWRVAAETRRRRMRAAPQSDLHLYRTQTDQYEPLRLSEFAFIVMTSTATSGTRLPALRETWVRRVSNDASRVLLISDRSDANSGEVTTSALFNKGSYWDAQKRHFEGLRVLYEERLPRNNRQCELFHQTVGSSPTLQLLPAWTLLADDDSYVNTLPHLLLHCTASDADYVCMCVCCCC